VYSDPGSGLFFLQITAAVFLTVVYRFRHCITALFTKRNEDRKLREIAEAEFQLPSH
jgi:hypothetical protein